MPQFIMPLANASDVRAFKSLDSFTQGYVEAMFFTECHSDNPELEDCTFDDLAPETLAKIIEDCHDYQQSFKELLERACEFEHYDIERAGNDFWYTRNGHGCGFWDRGLGHVGAKLTEMSFGSRSLYKGDDGKLYLA